MSRRMRFQIKPNLAVSAAASSEDSKATSAAIEAKNIPVTRASTPAVEDPTAQEPFTRPPTPVPTPALTPIQAPTATAIGEIEPNVVGENPETTQGPSEDLVQNDIITSEPTTSADKPMEDTTLAEETNISGEIPPPVAAVVQSSGPKAATDWRVMRNHLKGKKLDRGTFLMKDLIYWCPEEEENDDKDSEVGSTVSTAPGKRRSKKRPLSPHVQISTPGPSQKSEISEPKLNAPQLKLNEDGSIMVDESTLVIDRRDQGTEIDMDLAPVDETSSYRHGRPRITAMSFRRRAIIPRGKVWSKFETDKFYRVLSFTGLDFDLMHELFPTRSRVEIKRKYKRECNDDPARMDRALCSKIGRLGPWFELKKMIIERGRCGTDERSKELLESAKNLIEEEDERIEFEIGRRKPSVAEADRIAKELSKRGFGTNQMNEDDMTPEQLESMASKILLDLAKKDRRAPSKASLKKERPVQRLPEYQVETRLSSKNAAASHPLLVSSLEKPPIQVMKQAD